MAPSVYDRPRMEVLLFLEHGQFVWVHAPRSLSVAGPTLWSSLPVELKTTHIPLETFESKLKTYLFTIAYDHWRRLVKIIGWANQNIGGRRWQKVINGGTFPGCSPK